MDDLSALDEQSHFSAIVQQQQTAYHPTEMLAVVRLYDQFLQKYPHSAIAFHNRADLLKQLGFYELALHDAERALAIDPHFALGWCNKAFILNALGRYTEGWQAYEWRWKVDHSTFNFSKPPIPQWRGEPIGDDRLLLFAEQGFGDNIQFVRYAIEAKRRGLNVVVVNHTALEHLLHFNLERFGVETAPNGSELSQIRYYCPMMSLPAAFGTTLDNIPLPSGYLQAEPAFIAKWQTKLTACDRLKIGIVWAGSAKHSRDQQRSLTLDLLAPLFNENAEFHCLQKEVSEADRQRSDQIENLQLWDQALADFSDTAGLIAQMDLVISVDTSVAHLAAAMGKPTWIMLTYHPDFRWLLYRNDSPWYQSATLFRQTSHHNWQGVIARIQQKLHEVING